MASVEKRAAQKALKSKLGCEEEKDGDHIWYKFYHDGKRVTQTKVSHGGKKYKTLSNDLVSKMSNQLMVTSKMFREIVGCTKSLDDYTDALRDRRLIS